MQTSALLDAAIEDSDEKNGRKNGLVRVSARGTVLKILLPSILSFEHRVGQNRIRQIAFGSEEIVGSLAKFTSPELTGWLLTPNDGQSPVHMVGKTPKALTRDPAARVLIFAGGVDPKKYVDARIGKWFQHPGMLTSSTSQSRRASVSEAHSSWQGAFRYVTEDVARGLIGLRPPQVGALHAVHAHWSTSERTATVVMPTGTGKTETMLAVLLSCPCERVLVIVPTDALREQVAEKFLSLGVLKLAGCGVLASTTRRPVVGVLKSKLNNVSALDEFFESCNVVVTTSQIAGQSSAEFQERMAHHCSHLFIDEAHHAEAPTWKAFKLRFAERRVLQFTATPFREDGKLIDGKIIYTYPLRKAQEEGYFRPIKFASVFEFNPAAADAAISSKALAELHADKTGKHVVMARTATKERAAAVYAIYLAAGEFNPVLLHTGVSSREREESKRKLFAGESRIVVCVDMLGEGFDMPELKIAAFHDIRKSLAVTLQLAGRFTRTRPDLGDAVFIANIATIEVSEELRKLYTQDPDWNALLPELSETAIEDEVVAQDFIRGFEKFPAELPLKDLRPAASTVIYKTSCVNWTPKNFKKGLRGSSRYDQVNHSLNSKERTIVIATGSGQQVVWADLPALQNWTWDLYIAFWDPDLQLLFIHGSSNSGEFKDLAKALCGNDVELLVDPVLYRCLHGINRLMLTNVGLNEHFGRQIRYTGRMGSDVGSRLSDATKQGARKVVLAGAGFENGKQATVGAAKRGRVWSAQRLRLDTFVVWCRHIGKKVVDETIDPEDVLKGTLVPVIVKARPQVMPIAVDWPEFMLGDTESATSFFATTNKARSLSEVNLALVDPTVGSPLKFAVSSDSWSVVFQLELTADNPDIVDYRFACLTNPPLEINRGAPMDGAAFFDLHPPVFWFADGSSIEGNQRVPIPLIYAPYDVQKLVVWDWVGIDLTKESQGLGRDVDTIQYRAIQELMTTVKYDVIFDDDGSGEAADVVAIRIVEADKRTTIEVEFYHCKYSKSEAGSRVGDLYEVCGQGQKSVNWLRNHAKRTDLFTHLLKREELRTSAGKTSRFQVGDKENLIRIRSMSRISEVKLSIFLVQPGVSKDKISVNQLSLLAVTEHYLFETYQVPFTVIVSA